MTYVNMISVKGGTQYQRELMVNARALLEKVINTEEFKAEFLRSSFTETGGLSSFEIFTKLMQSDWKFSVVLYYSWWSRVVGYTLSNKPIIYVNSKYIGGPSVIGEASNLCHEMAHVFGFSHYSKPWSSTVPYQVNRIFETVCSQLKL